MALEPSCYQGAEGIKFGLAIIDELGAGAVSPTPANYKVWATYRSGELPDLNREIAQRFDAGEKLSPQFCEDLVERYFTHTQSFEQLLQTGESIAHELVGALEQLRVVSASAGGYAGELETVASAMEASTEPSSLQRLVRRLIDETRGVAARNRTLEARMETSSKHVEALQASIREATLDAVTDGLTGLANRKHFDRVLARRVFEASESKRPLCLIMCDIDHFKQVNDTWGHPVGDRVIRYVASTVAAVVSSNAFAARYGGEEYALLLPDADLEEAIVISQQLCERVRARSLARKSSGDVIGAVTISLGVACFRPGEPVESLVARADACLYRAKREGRNRVVSETSRSSS